MADGPFVKVYQSIVDDPMFARIYDTPALGMWLRMLLLAHAMYPASAPLPRRNSQLRLLVDVGLVELLPGNRYSMRGLIKERERKSDAARNAAAMRWQSKRNAEPMPSRREENRREESNGDARASTGARGRSVPQPDRAPGEAVVPRHEGQHPDCLVCATMRPQETADA